MKKHLRRQQITTKKSANRFQRGKCAKCTQEIHWSMGCSRQERGRHATSVGSADKTEGQMETITRDRGNHRKERVRSKKGPQSKALSAHQTDNVHVHVQCTCCPLKSLTFFQAARDIEMIGSNKTSKIKPVSDTLEMRSSI